MIPAATQAEPTPRGPRIVVDLGNTRIKWGRVGSDQRIADSMALPLDRPDAWDPAFDAWDLRRAESTWAIASVNPPMLDLLLERLGSIQATTRLFLSAAAVPLRHRLTAPERTGVDRALAVRAALSRIANGGGGHVVSCGTAITVESVSADGCWLGGAIAPGLGLSARALREQTAQLPLVTTHGMSPPALGTAPEAAVRAGVFWSAVGAVRELIARQGGPGPWIVWTGGDAPAIAPWVWPERGTLAPDLVLEGLAAIAFPPEALP